MDSKLFCNDAMTLKQDLGHRRWFEWVNFRKCNHYAQFDILHVYGVQENSNFKVEEVARMHMHKRMQTEKQAGRHYMYTSLVHV